MLQDLNIGHDPRRPPPLRMAGLWLAFALPVLAPLLFAVGSVQSVTLSPADVPSGSSSTGTVTLDPASPVGSVVDLLSSNPSLASVPKAIVVSSRNRTGTFAVNTGSGLAGCATISAQVLNAATPSKSAMLFVQPMSSSLPGSLPVGFSLSTNPVKGGQALRGSLTMFHTHAAGTPGDVIHLSSSNPTVTVPVSVTLNPLPSGGPHGGGFDISTVPVQSTTCAVIAAGSARQLLKVL